MKKDRKKANKEANKDGKAVYSVTVPEGISASVGPKSTVRMVKAEGSLNMGRNDALVIEGSCIVNSGLMADTKTGVITVISRGSTVFAPIVHHGTVINESADINRGVSLAGRVSVGHGSILNDSLVLDGAVIGHWSVVEHCVISRGCHIGNNVALKGVIVVCGRVPDCISVKSENYSKDLSKESPMVTITDCFEAPLSSSPERPFVSAVLVVGPKGEDGGQTVSLNICTYGKRRNKKGSKSGPVDGYLVSSHSNLTVKIGPGIQDTVSAISSNNDLDSSTASLIAEWAHEAADRALGRTDIFDRMVKTKT